MAVTIKGFASDWSVPTGARTKLHEIYTPKLTELHVFIAAGQSNMSGRGLPMQGSYDPADYRIFEYGAKTRTFRQAGVPLDMVDTPSGLSVATVFAREYLRHQPPGVGVLLVPAARGATGLIRETVGGVWNPDYTGTEPKLYNLMLTQASEALTAAETAVGFAPALKGFLWHQGEAETESGAYTQTDYAAALDKIITGVRTQFTVADLPAVVGGVVPDFAETYSNFKAIRNAHVGTVGRLSRTAYAPGVRGGGGSANLSDGVHYHRDGVEALGRRMEAAYWRALANTTDSIPKTPTWVEASFRDGALTVVCEQPLSRVTSYKVEYSIDGGAWVTAPAGEVGSDFRRRVTGLSGTDILVRVSSTNEVGTSKPTDPVAATKSPLTRSDILIPAPTVLSIDDPTSTLPTLSWETSPNAYSYEIWRSENSGSGWAAGTMVTARMQGTNSLTYTSPLTGGKQYRHWLHVRNAAGQYVTNVIEHTPEAAAPSASTLTMTNLTTTTADAAWTSTTDTTSFEMWRSEFNGSTWSTAALVMTRDSTVTSITVSGLTPGKSYRTFIRSIGPGGSTDSNTVEHAQPSA